MKRGILAWGVAGAFALVVLPAQAQTPPGPDWALSDTSTVRYFVPGADTPSNAVPAGAQAKAPAQPAQAPDGWIESNSQTVRYFVPGDKPPEGTVAATGAAAKSLGSGVSAPTEWYLDNTQAVRYFMPGETPPDGARQAENKELSDPLKGGTDWYVADTQTIRYWVPGASAPLGASEANGTQGKGGGGSADDSWYLAGSQLIKYFVPGADPNETSGGLEQNVSEAFGNPDLENQNVQVAAAIKLADMARAPKKGSVEKAGKEKWALSSSRQAAVGRMMHYYATYQIPRYQNVEYPYRLVDRYKKQTRKVDNVEITYRYDRVVDNGDGDETHDVGFRKVKEKRPGAWADTGLNPDPALDQQKAQAFYPPVAELVDTVIEELDYFQVPKTSTSVSGNSDAATARFANSSFSGSGGKGAAASNMASGGRQKAMMGDAIAKGVSAGNLDIDLSQLKGMRTSVFYGTQGGDTPFVFSISSGGGGLTTLGIFPVDSDKRIHKEMGAKWLLSDFHTSSPDASSGGVAAKLTKLSGKDFKLKLHGNFENKLTGKSYPSLDLGTAPGKDK